MSNPILNSISSAEINLALVKCVYSGKHGKCMCGCAGTYWYAREHRALAEHDRGYSVRDTEISDAMVKRIFNIINRSIAPVQMARGLDGELIMHTTLGDRDYVAYFAARAVRCEEQVHGAA